MAATTAIRNPQNRSFHITRGYSRDHRPDLNQVILDLMVEHQAGIPIPMKPLSGNSNDARGFGQVVRDHLAQLQITYGTTYVAADSALYSRDTLQQLAKTDMKLITHVPATLSEAQTAVTQANPETMVSMPEGYGYEVFASTYDGMDQRWVLIYSEH